MASQPKPKRGSSAPRRRTSLRSKFLDCCRAHPAICFAAVAALWVSLLYRHAGAGEFVYDDLPQIRNNSTLASWSAMFKYWGSAPHFSTAFRGGGTFYRPLFWASLLADRQIWGFEPSGFHFTNLVLHWSNGVAAFVLLRRFGVHITMAATSALLWLGLPIHCEAVAWISGRSYCLCTLFALLALLAAESYRDSRRNPTLLLYSGLFAAALLSHEMGIVLPPLAALTGCVKSRFRPTWMPLCAASLAGGFAYFGLRIHAGIAGPQSFAILPVGIALFKYLGWMVLPLQMSMERSTDFPADAATLEAVGALVLLAAAVGAIVAWRSRRPEVTTGTLWMIVALAPFSGLIFIYQGMAERYTYLASLGLAVAVAGLVSQAAAKARPFLSVMLILWASWGVWRLDARVKEWRKEASLYESSLRVNPNSAVLLYNLGVLAERSADFDTAAALYARSSSLNASYAAPVAGLANVDFARGNVGQMIQEYRRAVTLDPNDVGVRVNLGAALQRTGDLAGAEREYRAAISLEPERDEAHSNIGAVLFQEGRADQAINEFTRAVKINPLNRNAYLNLGAVYRYKGDFRTAATMFLRAEQIASESSDRRSFTMTQEAPINNER
jgi:Flp pilus assembly protein TadD